MPAVSSALLRTYFLKVARVPEPAGRMTAVIGSVGPPMSLQLVASPVKILVNWSVVRLPTLPCRSLLTIIVKATAATWWSVSAFLVDARLFRGEDVGRAGSTAPCEICVRPVPLPPAPMEDCVPCTVSNSAAASLMSGCNAEEPEARESSLASQGRVFRTARAVSAVPAVRSAAVAVQASRLLVVVPEPPVELVPHAARSSVAPSVAPMPSFVARERINVFLRAFTFP